VLLQDFTGVPCVVDLAAMRDAIKPSSAATPTKINPLVPGQPRHRPLGHGRRIRPPQGDWKQNVALEYERNAERYDFLKWGSKSLRQLLKAVPPGTGICHQVNLEHIAQAHLVERG
jgi:aconitate hydratase